MFNPEQSEVLSTSYLSPVSMWRGADIALAAQDSEHVLKNRLVAGEVTACYGPPKSGKTFVAIRCAFAAALDLEFWGQEFSLQGAPVVYIAAEREKQVARRSLAMMSSLGLASMPENLILMGSEHPLRLTSPLRQEEFFQKIAELNPALVIFDTYARLFDNNEDSSRDATDNISVLEQIVRASARPCAGLVIHHTGKDSSRGMRGSSAILASVTTAWGVSSKCGQVCLSLEDANDFDSCPPQHFEIQSFEIPEAYKTICVGETGVAIPTSALPAARNLRQEVLELWNGSETIWRGLQDIWVLFGEMGNPVGETTLSRVLKDLVDEELLERSKEGRRFVYRLRNDVGATLQKMA